MRKEKSVFSSGEDLLREFQERNQNPDKTKNFTYEKKLKKLSKRSLQLQGREEKFDDIDECLLEIKFGGKKLIPLKNKIVRDYNCQTILELMLAGRIATLYWRITRWEQALNNFFEIGDEMYYIRSYDKRTVNAIKELSRGVESAHRQLITSIALLKELKQPPINLQIKTGGAFIAQNQQVNVGRQRKRKSRERRIIKPQ